MANNAFISYSRQDKEFVQQLVEAFKNKAYDVWIDWEDIPLTADWMKEIRSGIEGADDFIFVISPASVASDVCKEELLHAVANNKRLVPVLWREVEDYKVVHPSLASHNWIFFNNGVEFSQSFDSLWNALHTDLEHKHTHTRLLTRAAEWESKNHNASLLLRGQDLNEVQQWLLTAANKPPRPTELQLQYVSVSRVRAIRTQRQFVAALVVGMICALLLAGYAFVNRNDAIAARGVAQAEAENARRRADEVQSLLLADNAEFLAVDDEGDRETALALALEANSIDSPPLRAQLALADIAYLPGVRRYFTGHTNLVTAVDISPDDRMAVSGSYDGSAILWNIETGETLRRFEEQALPVSSIAFAEDGEQIVAGLLDGSIVVWDSASGEGVQRIGGIRSPQGHRGSVNSIAVIPETTRFISAASDGQLIVWDITTGEEIIRRTAHSDDVTQVVVDPSGSRALSSSEDNDVLVWNLETWEVEQRFRGHDADVLALSISSDGAVAASASRDNIVLVWEVETGEIIWRLGDNPDEYSPNGIIHSVVVLPDNLGVVAGADDGSLILWDLDNGVQYDNFRNPNTQVLDLAVTSDSRSVLGPFSRPQLDNADQQIRLALWDIDNRAYSNYMAAHEASINSVDYSPDGSTIISGADDGNVILWELENDEMVTIFPHDHAVNGVAFNSDGQMIAAGGDDGTITIWDSAAETEITRYTAPDGVNVIRFIPDSTTVVAGLNDNTLLWWDYETDETQSFIGHTRRVQALAVSVDGATIVSGSVGRELFMWDVETGEILRRFPTETQRVLSLAYSPDGSMVVAGSDKGELTAWSVADMREIYQVRTDDGAIWGIDFDQTGGKFVIGSADGVVSLWDAQMGQMLRRIDGHYAAVFDVAFSPNGVNVVSVSRDQVVMMWETPTLDGLKAWTRENRYIPELTCEQRQAYDIESDCDSVADA